MNLTQALLILLTVLITIYHKKVLALIKERIHLYRALWKFDGPLALPLVGAAWQFKWTIREVTIQIMEWGRYYCEKGNGVIALWIGPIPFLFVVHPVHAKEILESNDIITKAEEYDILFPWLGTGLLTSTGEKWRQRRKLLTPTFHFKVLNDFISVHDYQAKMTPRKETPIATRQAVINMRENGMRGTEIAMVLIDELKSIADNGKEVDLFPYLKRMALDIICETSMGTTVDAQHNHDHAYVKSVTRLNEIIFQWLRKPWMKLKPIWYLSGLGYEFDHHLKIVTDFTKNVIAEKWDEYQKFNDDDAVAKDSKKMAFLDLLLAMRKDGLLNEEDIREEVDTFMFEGHDTTSASMGWTLWAISHYPDIQQKVHEEVDRVFGQSDRDCTNEDLKQLKYLEKCIKESLRMFPSVPFFARKVENDVIINGDLFPKGGRVVVAPLVLQRNPMWWKEPNTYNPENFSDEAISNRHAYADVPFSAGPRNCIGQKFALMEEKTCLSWVFRKYKLTATLPFEENQPCPEVIIKPAFGFPIKVESRF